MTKINLNWWSWKVYYTVCTILASILLGSFLIFWAWRGFPFPGGWGIAAMVAGSGCIIISVWGLKVDSYHDDVYDKEWI